MKHLYILIAACSFTLSIFRKKNMANVLPDFPLHSLSLDTPPETVLPENRFYLSVLDLFNTITGSENISSEMSVDTGNEKLFDMSSWTVRLG